MKRPTLGALRQRIETVELDAVSAMPTFLAIGLELKIGFLDLLPIEKHTPLAYEIQPALFPTCPLHSTEIVHSRILRYIDMVFLMGTTFAHH